MEYPEELSRQARWGIILGFVILIIGLWLGPSATVSRDEFSQLKSQVDAITTDLKATQTKVNGYEAPLNEVRAKVSGLDPKVTAIQEQMGMISSLIEEAKSKVESLSQQFGQKADMHSSELSQVKEMLARLEASVSEKSQVSVVFEDAELDGAGKPACSEPYLAAQLLNEKDAVLLRQLGIDKNGDGIVCILPTLVIPIELTQSGEPRN